MTRRMFGKLAVAAFTKVNSKVDGVTIGAQTYSFRDRPLDACIAAMKEIGLGEAELWDGHILAQRERRAGGVAEKSAARSNARDPAQIR